MRYLAIRHGESTWNADGLWQGQADPPLSPTGLEQARLLAGRLEHDTVDAVFSSDLSRAFRTAQAIAAGHGLDVQLRADLRERHVGPWQGMTRAELAESFPDEWASYLRHEDPQPGGAGETTAEMHGRIVAAFADIRGLARDAGWRTTLIVSHGGPVRAIAYAAVGLAVSRGEPMVFTAPDNTGVVEVQENPLSLRLITYNDTAHLLRAGADLNQTALDG